MDLHRNTAIMLVCKYLNTWSFYRIGKGIPHCINSYIFASEETLEFSLTHTLKKY